MKTVLPADFGRAATALCEAFPSVRRLESLLMSRLNRDFDYLTSRSLSLYDNALDITKKAAASGWTTELFEAARAEQPDNPVLRAFWDSLPDADSGAAPPPPADDKRPSLVCGRAEQWNEVCQCAPADQHQLLIVMGEVGQATTHFCERVHTYLSNDPRRSIVAVDWPPKRPASKEAFFEPLAKALQAEVATLAQVIANRLANENLVLLHDCVKVRFHDEALVSYYTTWLPELLSGTPNGQHVKCVQPIEWPASPRSLLRFFAGGSSDDAGEAKNLIGLLRSGQAAYLPLVELDELKDVTDSEIRSFVKTSALTASQKDRLLTELLASHREPEALFDTIDAYWNTVLAAP